MSYDGSSRRFLTAIIFMTCLAVMFVTFFDFGKLYSVFRAYSEIYSINSNVQFVVFMVGPLFAIFFFRLMFAHDQIDFLERFSFFYSSFLIFSAVIFFPFIAYRIALISVPIQLFLIVRSGCGDLILSLFIFLTLFFQLLMMIFYSDNYNYLFQ